VSALAERVRALEAANARLLDLAERQAVEQRRLCVCLERLTTTLERMAGVEAPAPEPIVDRPPCRVPVPARRRRIRGGGAR
jgi:hypothetical protein